MTLSPPVRTAVLEVVRRLRDPRTADAPEAVGRMLRDAAHSVDDGRVCIREVRSALGIHPIASSLAEWARGKSREEVAQALERVATSEASAR